MGAERILIIGGGVAGLSVAHALAGSRAKVTLFEAEGGLSQHSSGKNAAILRTAIDATATRRLALQSARRLRGSELGSPLLDEVGLLVATASDAPTWLAEHLAADEVHEVEPRELRRLAPHWSPAEQAHIWHLPRQGRLDVAGLVDGLSAGARAGGVELRTGVRVQAIENGGVTLAGGERVAADVVVVAAGGWAGALLQSTALRITRRHLLVTAPDDRVNPRWPVVWDDVAGLYARPESGGLLVCACDVEDTDPDQLVAEPNVKVDVARKVRRHLPQFEEAGAAHFWPGLRALTPDDAPLIGPDPRRPGVFWMAGLGGHGMSLSLSAGELAADLLLERPVDPDLRAAVDPGRFGGRG